MVVRISEIVASSVAVDSHGDLLPVPVVIGRGGRAVPARLVAEDDAGDREAAGPLRPAEPAEATELPAPAPPFPIGLTI